MRMDYETWRSSEECADIAASLVYLRKVTYAAPKRRAMPRYSAPPTDAKLAAKKILELRSAQM